MSVGRRRYEFTADEVTTLLADLDSRLKRRGAAAAVFIVGGAAVAVTHVRDDRLTADVDASAGELEAHIRRYYTDPGPLGMIVSGTDVDKEVRYLAEDAARMLGRTSNQT